MPRNDCSKNGAASFSPTLQKSQSGSQGRATTHRSQDIASHKEPWIIEVTDEGKKRVELQRRSHREQIDSAKPNNSKLQSLGDSSLR